MWCQTHALMMIVAQTLDALQKRHLSPRLQTVYRAWFSGFSGVCKFDAAVVAAASGSINYIVVSIFSLLLFIGSSGNSSENDKNDMAENSRQSR